MAGLSGAPGRAVVLIGPMGAGKSSAAEELAQALGVRAVDSDQLLEQRLGHTIAEEFEQAGEQSFRAAEEQLVCELLDDRAGPGLIALGGGSVTSQRVRDALARHVVVWLDVDPEEAWARVSAAPGERPLARDRDSFLALARSRRPIYEQLADAQLPSPMTGGAARALGPLQALAGAPAGTRMLWATSASGDYPVLVGRGLLAAAGRGELGEPWPSVPAGSRPFCVTDETVRALYVGQLGELALTVSIPAGESHKTLASAEQVWRALARAGTTRSDHLLALGGGVVGDLTGFCAATYQRGVPVVQVPTTLLAQVDSAYGGKTGVDLPEAKNYVGAYHQPAGVLTDPDTLDTLPAGELAAGWVEVLKTALLAGGWLWESVVAVADPPDGRLQVDPDQIVACVRTKLQIVASDERDAGQRRLLNLGHTVGHAIETATAYARYRHGEAVGLGLLAALNLSGQEALRAQVRELLGARGLPVTLDGVAVDEVLEALGRDKKRTSEGVPFVLLDAPGAARIDGEVDLADVRAAVSQLITRPTVPGRATQAGEPAAPVGERASRS